jgi:MYXO-CTERM domain-containing protein
MRNKSFTSSMVGIAAAAAVAGSVSAGFVDSFTTAFDTSTGTDFFGLFTYEYSSLSTSGPNASLFNTRYAAQISNGSRASSTGLGSASIVVGSVSTARAVLTYIDASSVFVPSGSTLDLSSTTGFSVNVGSWVGTGLTFKFLVFGAYDASNGQSPELGRMAVTVSGNGTVNFDKASFVPTAGSINWSAIGQVRLEMERTTATTGDGSTTSFTIDNFTNTVPAPGAFALLGAAGLVGSRRRRA